MLETPSVKVFISTFNVRLALIVIDSNFVFSILWTILLGGPSTTTGLIFLATWYPRGSNLLMLMSLYLDLPFSKDMLSRLHHGLTMAQTKQYSNKALISSRRKHLNERILSIRITKNDVVQLLFTRSLSIDCFQLKNPERIDYLTNRRGLIIACSGWLSIFFQRHWTDLRWDHKNINFSLSFDFPTWISLFARSVNKQSSSQKTFSLQ